MNVYVSLEHRFKLYKNGLYTDGAFSKDFWQRYLKVFEKVTIVARAKRVRSLEQKDEKVSGGNIDFYPIEHYIGFKEKLKTHFKVSKQLKKISNDKKSAYILRVGSPIADILSGMLIKNDIDYAVEVVGDPWDVFAPGAVENKLRPIMRWYFTQKLKKQCSNAKFSSYVTSKALQKRYPSPNAVISINASSIELREDFFYERENIKGAHWLFVGTLEQYQKAPDVLVKAFNEIKDKNITLTIIGDGRKKNELERICENRQVTFLGKLKNSSEVRKYLTEKSFFVLPSRGEGLPRAMIEAMACSCICVGSRIGGIEELIDEQFIVNVNDVHDLKNKIVEVSEFDNNFLINTAKRNFLEAKKYLKPILDNRREMFYKKIKESIQ